jgi:uncharacterized coiled-coil protein SlyX
MARTTNGKRPPSATLTRLLEGQKDIQVELAVIRLAQDRLTETLRQMTETWTGMFRQLGLQLDLLALRVGERQETLGAHVEALDRRLTALETRGAG